MDLFARFIGIMVVFVIFIAVDVEGAAYGEACSADGDCGDGNQACSTNCVCATDFFRQTTAEACVAKVLYNANCDTAQTSSEQCKIANQECVDVSGTDKCQCTADFFPDTAACAARKNPDIACTATGQCITNAECDVSGTGKCECNAGYTETPTDTPTMCSGVVKFASLSYMYVVPILVSMMSLLR